MRQYVSAMNLLNAGLISNHEQFLSINREIVWASLAFAIIMIILLITLFVNIQKRRKAEQQLRRNNDFLASLHQTALELMNRHDINDLLLIIVKRAGELAGAQHGYIYLVNDLENCLELKLAADLYTGQLDHKIGMGQGVAGTVWQTGQPVVVNNYKSWDKRLPEWPDTIEAVAGIPLVSANRLIGVIGLVQTADQGGFEPKVIEMLAPFFELASLALDNARLHAVAQRQLHDRERIEKALRRSESRNKAIINALPDLLLRISKYGIFLEAIAAKDCASILPAAQYRGKLVSKVLPPDVSAKFTYYINQTLRTGETQIFEYSIVVDQEIRVREARMVVCMEDEVLTIVRDITQRKKMEEELRYFSFHDQLTGLYNRFYFEQEMERLSGRRYQPLGIIICDVNALKLVNDTLGHVSGDSLILAAAAVFKQSFRDSDIIARVGGDEFAILLPQTPKTVVKAISRRLAENIERYNETNPKVPLSLSVGYAVSNEKTTDINEVYREADMNMYREKIMHGEEVRSFFANGLIKALTKCDFFDTGHAERLEEYTRRMGTGLRLTERQIDSFCLLARYHDIGKVNLPEYLLMKNEKLTTEEQKAIERHCEIGYRIAKSIPDLAPVADWILKHHERWDGSGYPLGLAKAEIPLASRVLAIVDAYDAMTSPRPYRRAMQPDEAVAELMRCSGSQFDPELVVLFISILNNRDIVLGGSMTWDSK